MANALIEVGTRYDKKVIALITSMEQPLGNMIGNWLEVVESVLCLKGKQVPDLLEVTFRESAEMFLLAGKVNSISEGIDLCKKQIQNGSAYNKFLEMVKAQGGDVSMINDLSQYPKSKYTFPVTSLQDGFITSINTREVGIISNEAGAGRGNLTDVIDPKAGIVLSKKVGEKVKKGEFIATLFTDKNNPQLATNLQKTFSIGAEKINLQPLIRAKVTISGVEELTIS